MIQLQVLNKLLLTQDASFITINNINEDFFSEYRNEFLFIKEHLNKYGSIPDRETFIAKFPDFDIISVNESFDYLLDALFEDRNKRYLASTFNKIRNYLNEGKTEDALNYFLSTKDNLSVSATHMTSVDVLRDTSRYDKFVERSYDFNKYYVKTGFKELDEIIGGWDRQEELATIVARPNVGKSFILFKIATAAAQQGLRVGIYSGEMSETKVGYRIDTLISHISNHKLIHGNVEVQNDYKKYLDEVSKSIPGEIRVITPAMIGGTAGVNALKGFIQKEKLDMLCIDQHSLLEDDRRAKNPVERAANISRDLKNLQVSTRIPIIAVSQQNREKNENGPDTTNVAQTDRISQDSTILIFLEQKEGIMTFTLVKSRDSSNGQKLKYAINLDKGIFEYIPNEKDATNGSKCQELKNEFEVPSSKNEEDTPF